MCCYQFLDSLVNTLWLLTSSFSCYWGNLLPWPWSCLIWVQVSMSQHHLHILRRWFLYTLWSSLNRFDSWKAANQETVIFSKRAEVTKPWFGCLVGCYGKKKALVGVLSNQASNSSSSVVLKSGMTSTGGDNIGGHSTHSTWKKLLQNTVATRRRRRSQLGRYGSRQDLGAVERQNWRESIAGARER